MDRRLFSRTYFWITSGTSKSLITSKMKLERLKWNVF